MDNYKLILGYLEKLSLGVWGFNLIDLMAISDINFLKNLDSNLATYLSVIGAVYLTLQIPFKILELISKKEHNRLVNELKAEDLKDKKNNKKELKIIKDKVKLFDEVHNK